MINVWAIILVILLLLAFVMQWRTTLDAAVKERYVKHPEAKGKSGELGGLIMAAVIWFLFLGVCYGSVIAIALAAINFGR
jgi:hypothetical protein